MTENEWQNKVFTRLVRNELKYDDFFIYSVPNGGIRDKVTARIMQWTGLRKGVSDLHIIGGGKIIMLELKKGSKGVQSVEQKVFESKIKSNGFKYILSYPNSNDIDKCLDELEKEVMSYLYG